MDDHKKHSLTGREQAYRRWFLDFWLDVARRGSAAHARWEARWLEQNDPHIFTGFEEEFTKALSGLRARVVAGSTEQAQEGAIPAVRRVSLTP